MSLRPLHVVYIYITASIADHQANDFLLLTVILFRTALIAALELPKFLRLIFSRLLLVVCGGATNRSCC